MDVDTLRSIFQAFLNTFPHVISFANIDTGDFMLLGSLGEIHYDFDRVSKRMQREDISKALAAHDVYDPGDLLWYFALSQSELIKAANNAVPNRDTNIFSEVKLSALSSKLAPSEDPYPFLKKHYKLDLSQYIGKEQYPDRLYRLGKLFLQWDSPDSAIKVAQQLQTVSGRHYHALQHKILVWQHNYKEAVAWFEKQPNLFDENLLEQMRIYRSIKLYPKARQLVENISAPTTRDAARAELAYYSGNTNLLRRTPAENQQALQWLLLMRLGSGDKQAASALEKIVLNGNADVEVIRKLTAFYLNTNSRQKANHYLDLLKQNIDARVKRYRWLIDFAMDSNNKDWAKELFENIKTLAPDHEDLPDLMTRLESSILKKDRLTQATQKPPL